MSDSVIKNPNRNRPPNVKVEKYQPEYERLGVEPVVEKFDRQAFQATQATAKSRTKVPLNVGSLNNVPWEMMPSLEGMPSVEAVGDLPEDDINLEETLLEGTMPQPSVEEFVLVNANKFSDIIATGNEYEIKSILAQILQETDCMVDDFVLYKRVKIKVGIFIEG